MEPDHPPRDRSWRIAAIAIALFAVALVLVVVVFYGNLTDVLVGE